MREWVGRGEGKERGRRGKRRRREGKGKESEGGEENEGRQRLKEIGGRKGYT